mmetsp:Transcript_2109/g.7641  ORF Transcript_2109/g.7641 Transcript_2109/m.7641 type:complete len:104 (-) Transcript_2109:274-585(-)
MVSISCFGEGSYCTPRVFSGRASSFSRWSRIPQICVGNICKVFCQAGVEMHFDDVQSLPLTSTIYFPNHLSSTFVCISESKLRLKKIYRLKSQYTRFTIAFKI